jgi:hypothetical protein
MSLFDDASLVITPSGYKEGKLYSIKPTDGSGDLSVTRATTATRVNSAGLVEVVPYNLLTYSEQFDNADWIKTNVTVTTNATNAPNGSLTAEKIIATAIDGNHILSQSPTFFISNATYNFSYYAKSAEYTKCGIRIGGPGYATVNLAAINLTNGSIISQQGFTSLSVTLINNGWYRISGSFISGTGLTVNIQPLSDSYTIIANNFSYLGNGTSGIFAWGGQLEVGSSAKEYYPTTTRLNIPRLDYTNGSCPSILVEPQRTNVLTYSQDFTNSAWAKSDVTITANSIISPSGILNGSKIIPNSNNTFHAFYESVPTGVYSFSIYAKAGGETTFSMWVNDFSKRAIFDLSSGTITSSNVTNSTITNVGNGWYRCTVYDTTSTSFVAVYGRNGGNFVGNGVDGIYFWGGQVEAGAYPTSYIPTTSATVTRNADVISKTGISSLIGQTEGTIFVDFNHIGLQSDSNGSIPIVIKGTVSEAYILITGGGTLVAELYNIGSQCVINGAIGAVGRKKIAFGYKNNDFVMYMNGVLIGTDTTGTVGSMTELFIGSYYVPTYSISSGVNSAQLFKTRLSNAELAQLTTL